MISTLVLKYKNPKKSMRRTGNFVFDHNRQTISKKRLTMTDIIMRGNALGDKQVL